MSATDEDALIGGAVEWLGETALRDAARTVFANSPRTVNERAAGFWIGLAWILTGDRRTGSIGATCS